MEKHRCKLCFRNFDNGRALGGHMRSHMMNLYAPKNGEENEKLKRVDSFQSFESDFSTSEEENDPQLSVVLQDRASETDSSKKNPVRRRSKRVRRSGVSGFDTFGMREFFQVKKKPKMFENECSSLLETEPLSSISDTTPDEDVAYCLIMLSRDKWKREEETPECYQEKGIENTLGEEDDDSHDSGLVKVVKIKVKGKYRCETCNKMFRSYQALGGHRASHKKIKFNNSREVAEINSGGGGSKAVVEVEKLHKCPFCDRVFSSGQALGGHKRSHFIGAGAISANAGRTINRPFSRIGGTLSIDLNLPAPVDDEDGINQIVDNSGF